MWRSVGGWGETGWLSFESGLGSSPSDAGPMDGLWLPLILSMDVRRTSSPSMLLRRSSSPPKLWHLRKCRVRLEMLSGRDVGIAKRVFVGVSDQPYNNLMWLTLFPGVEYPQSRPSRLQLAHCGLSRPQRIFSSRQ